MNYRASRMQREPNAESLLFAEAQPMMHKTQFYEKRDNYFRFRRSGRALNG